MIEHIRTIGFKGFDIDEDIPQKVIYTGKNKSGKSTRAGAIAIALYGHIPFSTAGKRPGDILESFGKDSMIVAVTIGGKEFGRKFSRNEKGSVSQVVQVDKKRVSTENFAILLDRAGGPRIADVAEFMKQSETKKINTLFDLFPNDELDSIDTEIENAKVDVSRLEKKKTGAESTVVRLTNSKQGIEIPSGSIAETQSEINSVEIKIVELEEEIKQAEIEEAKADAKEEGKKEAAENMVVEKETGVSLRVESFLPSDDPLEAEISKGEQQIENYKANSPDDSGFPFQHSTPNPVEKSLASISIQRIIGALNGSGCNTCAALIVAKQELKKYKEVS